uniref:Uncharacterized protein n=1 Tax=Romanomermis culicivorax TaxID=13658 RepID=A0A915HS26_ROMCU
MEQQKAQREEQKLERQLILDQQKAQQALMDHLLGQNARGSQDMNQLTFQAWDQKLDMLMKLATKRKLDGDEKKYILQQRKNRTNMYNKEKQILTTNANNK